MTLFSKKGEKSTTFERAFFVSVLVIAAAFVTPGINETVQMNRLFSQADSAIRARCQASSNYSVWRFWDTQVQAYSKCIVLAKDPAVQNAAGKYLLQGNEGEFTVAPNSKPAQTLPITKAP